MTFKEKESVFSKIRLKNYRLWRDATLEISPGAPLVLIGPNGSGKSTWIDVFQLFGDILKEGVEEAIEQKRRGMEAIRTAGSSERETEIEISFQENTKEKRESSGSEAILLEIKREHLYTLTFAERQTQVFLKQESYKQKEQRISLASSSEKTEKEFLHLSASDSWMWNKKLQKKDEMRVPSSSQTLLSSVFQSEFYPDLADLRAWMEKIYVYPGFSTLPTWARLPREQEGNPRNLQQFREVRRIDRRGESLVMALYYIHSQQPLVWERLIYHFCEEFPAVHRLTFPPMGNRVTLAYEDKRYRQKLFLDDMSDGMLSYLGLLCALLVDDQATCLIFDEPDAHLHPSAIRRLVELIEAKAEQTPVLLATHSDRLLDFLSFPSQSIAICEPDEGGAKLLRPAHRALDEWLKDYTLSELRAQGQLDSKNRSLQEKFEGEK